MVLSTALFWRNWRCCRSGKGEHMNEQILKAFEQQEKEDQLRMTTCLEHGIREELDRPERYIRLLSQNAYPPEEILRLSIKEMPVRVSSGFSIRKHTLCQIPYFHTHDFYELIYIYQGSSVQYLTGEKEALEMKRGDICLFTPGKIHAMMPSSKQDIVLKMILPKTLMKQIRDGLRTEEGLKNLADMLDRRNEVYIFPGMTEQDPSVRYLIESLMKETYREAGKSTLAVKSLLHLLFIKLARGRMECRKKALLNIISDYIQRNIKTARLDALAEELGYSVRHLGRRIAEETGGSFSDILIYIRVQKAADLLAETDLLIDDVARESGYKNASGLYKRFAAVYGMSPGDYRKLYRG